VPGEQQPLPLPTGQAPAAVPDDGLPSVRQPVHDLQEPRPRSCPLQVGIGCAGPRQQQIGPHRRREDMRVLASPVAGRFSYDEGGCPATRTVPSASTSPASAASNVLFPAPLAPTTATRRPRSTRRSIPCRAHGAPAAVGDPGSQELHGHRPAREPPGARLCRGAREGGRYPAGSRNRRSEVLGRDGHRGGDLDRHQGGQREHRRAHLAGPGRHQEDGESGERLDDGSRGHGGS
jgi:hypothetical protein